MSTTLVKDFMELKGMKIVHLNTRSMYGKKDEIFRKLSGVDIVTMSETWLHAEVDNDLVMWSGMKLFRQERKEVVLLCI